MQTPVELAYCQAGPFNLYMFVHLLLDLIYDGDKQVGICGEHGGEPSSIAFFAEAGLDYVSCSPFRLTCHGTLKFSNAAS